jgi:SNF2 family DNA or RNA helicase
MSGKAVIEPEKKRWAITVDPDVMVDLKRVFAKADKRDMGTVFLSDTPECARRLHWFSQLHPLAFEPESYLLERKAEYEEQCSTVDRILAAGYSPPKFEMAMHPRPYQAQAGALCLASGALLLGDATGVGKTLSAFTILTDPRALPALYVTLTALPWQVEKMLKRAIPGLRTHIIKKGTPYDLGRMPDVVITSWSKLKSDWASWWGKVGAEGGLGAVIFDEMQELRHPDTERYKAASHVAKHARFKLGLSATPVYGAGSQIFNLVEVLRPGALGTWEEFCREFCGTSGGEKPAVKDPGALGLHLRKMGLMLARSRADVGRELPKIQRIILPIEMDEEPLKNVAGRAAELARIVLRVGGDGLSKMKASGEIDMLLRQATGIGKAKAVGEFVAMLVESGEQVVVYCWHREVYRILNERLKQWSPAMYTGSESQPQKREAKRRFCDRDAPDHTPILLMSLRSAQGLDELQHVCSVIVVAELDFAHAVLLQAEGRIDRDGQTRPVVAYYPIASSGSDPEIIDLLGFKKAQLDGLMRPGEDGVEKAPDQTAIIERVKRLAAGHLARHDPASLKMIDGASDYLVKPEDEDIEDNAPRFVPPPEVRAARVEARPALAALPWLVDPTADDDEGTDVTDELEEAGFPLHYWFDDPGGGKVMLRRYDNEDGTGAKIWWYDLPPEEPPPPPPPPAHRVVRRDGTRVARIIEGASE